MQSVVKFICLLQVGAICLQYSLLVSRIFIVLLEIKLQYFMYLLLHSLCFESNRLDIRTCITIMNNGTFN